jgi:hypothetical protein
MAQKVNSELLAVTHWLGQSVGGTVLRVPEFGPRALCYKSLCKVALA